MHRGQWPHWGHYRFVAAAVVEFEELILMFSWNAKKQDFLEEKEYDCWWTSSNRY